MQVSCQCALSINTQWQTVPIYRWADNTWQCWHLFPLPNMFNQFSASLHQVSWYHQNHNASTGTAFCWQCVCGFSPAFWVLFAMDGNCTDGWVYQILGDGATSGYHHSIRSCHLSNVRWSLGSQLVFHLVAWVFIDSSRSPLTCLISSVEWVLYTKSSFAQNQSE